LSCSTSVQRLLIESSSFFSCSTSSVNGGAIYFSNTNNGESVLYKVCGNDCISTYTDGSSYGQFARISVNDGISIKNYVNYSSISRCVNDVSNSFSTLYLYNGKICCQSVNISMNKCYSRSGIQCNPYTVSNYATLLISYSSFTNNIATGSMCIFQGRAGPETEMKCCNILGNLQGSSDSDGTVRLSGHSTVKDSCILMNNATNTFWAYSSYIITVSNCTIDSTKNQNSVILTNAATKSFIHALNHISTENCASEYDSAGTLTVIENSKKNIIYTCNCQPGISYLFKLTYLFMITFIHSNSSS
jgi:hypothetical protein